MSSPYRHIQVQQVGDVACVSLHDSQLDDATIRAVTAEIEDLVLRGQHHKVVLSLGDITCLYSVLIAKLIKLRRLLAECNGTFKLCNLRPEIREVFDSCQLQAYFDLAPDVETAVRELAQEA
jgi:serine/threonine-protein kinase RsbW